jgi:hypothetical protein
MRLILALNYSVMFIKRAAFLLLSTSNINVLTYGWQSNRFARCSNASILDSIGG